MRLQHLQEPELEFAGGGPHVDIRFGIMTHGPLDRLERTDPRRIRLGVIGTSHSIEGFLEWLCRCKTEIPAKESKYPNLFPSFPGFRGDAAFHSEIECEPRMQRRIANHQFTRLGDLSDYNAMIQEAADLFVAEARYLVQETNIEVVACAIPPELVKLIDREEQGSEGAFPDQAVGRWQFHDVLKARGMSVGRPIQMIRPSTYGGSRPKKSLVGKRSSRIQDEATRAWNIHIALYYKAKGVPWRLQRLPSDLTTCHVGVSFYRTLDRESVHTSVAQVFNQRGEGVIVRGGPAQISKEDRTPHLSAEDGPGVRYKTIISRNDGLYLLDNSNRFNPR